MIADLGSAEIWDTLYRRGYANNNVIDGSTYSFHWIDYEIDGESIQMRIYASLFFMGAMAVTRNVRFWVDGMFNIKVTIKYDCLKWPTNHYAGDQTIPVELQHFDISYRGDKDKVDHLLMMILLTAT